MSKAAPGKRLFGFVSNAISHQNCRFEVTFNQPGGQEPVPAIHLKAQGKYPAEAYPLYQDASGSSVCGTVKVIALQNGQKVDHQGLRVQLVGTIELLKSGVKNHEFLSLSRELSGAGDVRGSQEFPFEFTSVDLSMDSFRGATVRLRYFVRVTLSRGIGSAAEEFPLWVQNASKDVPPQEAIKLEVGIENCLHLEFTYNSSVYPVDGCVLGSVHFKLVKISLKTMELEVRRKEITSAAKASPDVQTLYKYELMDGAPVRGEVLPVRLHLAPLELSPTYDLVQSKFSVKYLLNLVLVDSEDRRYFKQHEITLVRGAPAVAGEAAGLPAEPPGSAEQAQE